MKKKEDFQFNKEGNQWVCRPFVISTNQYETMDWIEFKAFSRHFFNFRIDNERKSIKALFDYAKEIDFFTKEEFDDLGFVLFDVTLLMDGAKIKGFVMNYGVDENENSKIPWKDLYGIWKVFLEENEVKRVTRE